MWDSSCNHFTLVYDEISFAPNVSLASRTGIPNLNEFFCQKENIKNVF